MSGCAKVVALTERADPCFHAGNAQPSRRFGPWRSLGRCVGGKWPPFGAGTQQTLSPTLTRPPKAAFALTRPRAEALVDLKGFVLLSVDTRRAAGHDS